jgi:deoxyribonuclease V
MLIVISIDVAVYTLLSSNLLYGSMVRQQKQIAKRIITKDNEGLKIKYVCGVDVSYKHNIAYCSATVIEKYSLNAVESTNAITVVDQPYIPGLFILREYKPIIDVLQLVKKEFQILLVDGHGLLHPRRCGLASYIGVMINKPTIGVAKSLLCGSVRTDKSVEVGGDVLGLQMRNCGSKHIYVSIGHKISLPTAAKIVKELTIIGQRIPEPLRIADMNSKRLRQLCTN